MKIKIIGAGLAGCEEAWQIAKKRIEVELWEMKPQKFSPAHKSENFAELVCSNSLKSDVLSTASGLLKAELRLLGCSLIDIADKVKVPAGSALAVDREKFADMITELNEEGKIKCNCQNNAIARYDFAIKDGELTVFCEECDAELKMPMTGAAAARDMVDLDELVLR